MTVRIIIAGPDMTRQQAGDEGRAQVGYHQADCRYLIYHLLGKARQGNLRK